MATSDLLGGLELLQRGIKTRQDRKEEKRKEAIALQKESETKAARQKLGTELLAQPEAVSTPATRFAARALEEGIGDEKEALGALKDMKPEEAVFWLLGKSMQTADPKIRQAAAATLQAFENWKFTDAKMKAKGEAAGEIEGGGLLLRAAGRSGGGGGASGGTVTQNEYFMRSNQFLPALQDWAKKTGIKNLKGKDIVFKTGKPIKSQLAEMSSRGEIDNNITNAIVDQLYTVTHDVVRGDPVLGHPLNAGYANSMANNVSSTFLTGGVGALVDKPVYSKDDPSLIESYDDRQIGVSMPSNNAVMTTTMRGSAKRIFGAENEEDRLLDEAMAFSKRKVKISPTTVNKSR